MKDEAASRVRRAKVSVGGGPCGVPLPCAALRGRSTPQGPPPTRLPVGKSNCRRPGRLVGKSNCR